MLRFVALLLLSCISCSSLRDATTDTPSIGPSTATIEIIPTSNPLVVPVRDFPGVVTGFAVQGEDYVLIAEQMCIYLRQAFFWEPGDYLLSFDSLPLTRITLDNHEIAQPKRFMSGLLEFEYDEHGNEIGAHGFSFDLCIPSPVEDGRHTIVVEVTSTSGIVRSYTWEFISDTV